MAISLDYEGLEFEEVFRADLLVERKVIVEIKCVEKLNYAHKKQLLTYLRLADMGLGYLLNFGEALMKNGITRTVHGLRSDLLLFLLFLGAFAPSREIFS